MAKRNLNEKNLANLANVTEEQVHFLLRGSLKTDLRTIAAISVALGLRASITMETVTVLDKLIEEVEDLGSESLDDKLRRCIRL